jgi:hypothetical protein
LCQGNPEDAEALRLTQVGALAAPSTETLDWLRPPVEECGKWITNNQQHCLSLPVDEQLKRSARQGEGTEAVRLGWGFGWVTLS